MTAHLDVNGNAGTSATISVPQVGIWLADVDLDGEVALAGRVTFTVGAVKFQGTVDPDFSGTFATGTKLRIVGGANGWSNEISEKPFHSDSGVRLATLIQDAANACGETAVVTTDARLGVDFIRRRGPAVRTLARLVESWWVDYAGVTRVGPRPASIAKGAEVLKFDPRTKLADLAVDDPSQVEIGSVLTDSRFATQTVRAIEFKIDAHTSRAVAWCGQ